MTIMLFMVLNTSCFPGLKYQQENEEELKDKMDFAKADPTHYPPSGN